jgi:hypothetical protein
MSIETLIETYPLLLVAPFSALMFVSARQDRSADGSVSPFNYSLWMGALLPFGWACGSADRPWQLAGMVTVLVVYVGCAMKTFLPRPKDVISESQDRPK